MVPHDDLAARLAAALRPEDLRLSGAALTRRISGSFRGRAGVEEFRRVAGDASTLVVRLSETNYSYGKPFLVEASSGRVRAIAVPITGTGATLGAWRRRGDALVGALYDVQGNWALGAVVTFRRSGSGWRLAAFRETEHETAGTTFVRGVERLRVSTRSYRFRFFDSPHAGPLLIEDATWTVGKNGGIVAGLPHIRANALAAFDRFADAVARGDGRLAHRLCAPLAYERAVRTVRGHRSDARFGLLQSAPGHGEEGRFFGFREVEGEQAPTLYFELARRGGRWRIVGLRKPGRLPPGRL